MSVTYQFATLADMAQHFESMASEAFKRAERMPPTKAFAEKREGYVWQQAANVARNTIITEQGAQK